MFRFFSSSNHVSIKKFDLSHVRQYSGNVSNKKSNCRICFVHTPMVSFGNQAKKDFWREFDRRYYRMHPHATPVDASIWELPHWIPWLAGVLKANNFNNINYCGLYDPVSVFNGVDEDVLIKDLKEKPSDVFLFSPMTHNLHLAKEMAAIVKQIYPKSTNIFGGVIATPLSDKIIKDPNIDYIVVDRGEYALPELLDSIFFDKQKNISELRNVVYYDSKVDKIFESSSKHPPMLPKDLPFPYYDIFPKELGKRLRYIRLNYGLGCPFHCAFCTIQTINQATNYFPVSRVIEELRAYRSHYGKDHIIYFGDETFTLDKHRTFEVCDALEKENVIFNCQTRLMSMNNRKELQQMYKSGCRWLETGIETLNFRSMFFWKQHSNARKTRDILAKARDEGIPVCSFMIHGLPDQTLDDMRRSTDELSKLLQDGYLHATYYDQLVPHPGSKIFCNPENYGIKLRHYDLRLYTEEGSAVYDTQHATAEEINKLYAKCTKQLTEVMAYTPYLGADLDPKKEKVCGLSLTHP